jgi:hypothetical protein
VGNPLRPTNDPQVWSWLLVQHSQVLDQMTIGIAQVDGCRRHPADYTQFHRLHAEEREWFDPLSYQALRCIQEVIYGSYLKRHMQTEAIGAVPSDHRPSIDRLEESPIQKKVALCSDVSNANRRPTVSR